MGEAGLRVRDEAARLIRREAAGGHRRRNRELPRHAASFQIASLRHSLDLATESLRLTRLRYQAGEVSVLEVVDAQSTLVEARNANDDGMARYRLAVANLQTLTGAF